MVADPGVWLYAVASAIDERRLAGMVGVGGQPVRTVPGTDLVAVVESVDLAEFGEEPLRRKLNDLDALARLARAHHRIIDAAAHLTEVVPARLATVYRGDEGVAAMLDERREALCAALGRVAGRVELGVKAYATPAASREPAESAGGGSPGTAYLMRRREQLASAEQARRAAVEVADGVHLALSRMAEDARRHPPQDPRLSGEAAWMVLNGAYLVDRERVGEFADAVRVLADRHHAVRLELTGPWPPYSFAADEQERGA